MKQKTNTYQRMLAAFFLLMLFFTIISRIYDTITIPQVTTAVSKRKQVINQITGSGTVTAGETVFVDIYPGCKTESVSAVQGDQVKTGEELLRYQMGSLLEKKETLELELDKLMITLEKEQISSEIYPNVTQEELALQEAAIASRELEEARADYDQAWADYHENIEKLEREYQRKAHLTEEELWNENQQQYIANRNSLDDAKRSMEEAVIEADRQVEDAKQELAQLEDSQAPQADIQKAQKALERAREDADAARRAGEGQVDSARDRLEFAGDIMDRIDRGTTSSQIALKEAYEEKIKQEEEKLRTSKENQDDQEKAWNRAQQAVSNARKADANTQLTGQQKTRLSELTQKGLQMDIDSKRKELAELEELILRGGILLAAQDGVIVTQEIVPGKHTTGEELLELAVGTTVFEGTFEKESQSLNLGDILSLSIPGSNRNIEVPVTGINLLTEKGTFRAELSELNLSVGTVTSYKCQKQSDIYQQVLPLSGLRKDDKGYYVLVAQAGKAILGEEFRAVRKDVSLLYQGDSEAAVEGSILPEEAVIVNSNKVVHEGDRIRVVMES